MIKSRRLLLPAGVLILATLALVGWLWVDRGVGIGLRGQARDVLGRYDDAVAKGGGTPGAGLTAPPAPTDKFLRGNPVESATTSRGSTTLIASFTGFAPGDGQCEREYYAEALESERAVVIVVQGKPRNLLERLNLDSMPGTCDLIGYRRTATVTLAEPLNNRVLLDERGQPVKVSVTD
jgi:hypothetical protein